jgi:hypothetical protein
MLAEPSTLFSRPRLTISTIDQLIAGTVPALFLIPACEFSSNAPGLVQLRSPATNELPAQSNVFLIPKNHRIGSPV